ncbi:hypothetical protein [uncultured Desulfovibrio sp.]|uniref:PGN_0703 family putative restriction endonuclease n=1 Tax=uncultured Desulfovibrio sp. TaxID=167968 RepID=UPI002637C43B|nr:hypothetical protein [uncultured Desulfovibrio sp.]
MTYKEARLAHHLKHFARLFEDDPGGGKFNGQPRPFVLQEAEKNIWAPIRENVLLYFNGHWPEADGKISFWRSGGEKLVGGHVCRLPTGHVLSSQVACINHLFPLCRDKGAATMLLRGLRSDIEEALPVDIHARGLFVEFEVVGGGSYLNEESRSGQLMRGMQATSVDAVMKGRDSQGNIRLFLIEWKYTEKYGGKKRSHGHLESRLWRYRSFFTRDSSPFTFCNSDRDSKFFQELLTEPYYQLMRQTLLGWRMIQDPQHNGDATCFTHLMVIPRGNTVLRSRSASIADRGGSLEDEWNALVREPALFPASEELLRPLAGLEKYAPLLQYLALRYWREDAVSTENPEDAGDRKTD